MIDLLPPLPVAGPLAIAGLLLAFGRVLPSRVPDVVAVLTALGSAAICVVMAMHAGEHPLIYWFGGWTPRTGQALGISFVVDQAGAAFAAFIGLLFAATLVFAWGYFDEVQAHFHVLMLLFMAGMTGFCLTHDLFNLFVWFEVMSVAAFAVTGYALRPSALEGALTFTVVNTIGSYLILGGIGLIYAQVGALDFAALERGVAAAPGDAVITASFVLLATGLLIKAAQVPFQFWLSDAHAVAPSPVSVIFSGAMVSIGLYGVAKLTWAVFAPSDVVLHVVRTLLLGMGVASAIVGGVMAVVQRHVKRLLAFSTISHTGIMLIGLALLNREGLSGMLVYMAGHGLVKGALFMVAGILMASCGGIDEIGLRGKGRDIWPAGVAMAAGGLLLAGLPIGLMDKGTDLIEAAGHEAGKGWVMIAVTVGAACTGGAVLRVTGRVFLGLGQVPGEEERSPTEEEQEKADRPLWLMLAPTVLLLVLALPEAEAAGDYAMRAATSFMHPDVEAILGLRAANTGTVPLVPSHDSGGSWMPWVSVALAVAIAAFELTRRRLPERPVVWVDRITTPVLNALSTIHSGLIGDYVTWVMVGLALFGVVFAFS
ncbi:complex I subunit 5 family protein [Rhodopila sp.]|uniref:complex I subunit 5 family protein n=1 Tax=Rhodopila sp. TaxID=2480087 RepID=UPI003D09F2A8